MGLVETLLSQGYTLPGADKNTILSEGGDPMANVQTGKLANLVRGMQELSVKKKLKQEEEQKKMTDQLDHYKTLRSSGYSPAQAHEAVMKMKFPVDVAGTTTEEQQAAANVEKTKAETAKATAEAAAVGEKKTTIESRIMQKLANGEDLNAGEQKIYDDIIKKKNTSKLAEYLANEDNPVLDTAVADTQSVPMVNVVSPDGKNGRIPKSKLPAALKKGFKQR